MNRDEQARDILDAVVRCAREKIAIQITSPIVLLAETWLAGREAPVAAWSPPTDLTPEQLAARVNTLGASEIASALGLNPWRSQHALWCLKRGLIEDKGNVRTRAGSLIEPVVRQMYREETGATLGHFGTLVHPEHPWLSATPDGLVSGESRGLEIKVVGWRSALHWTDKPDGIPDYYRTQVEQCMAITGAREWDVAALIGGTDFRIYRIQRDEELWGRMFARAKRFWFDHVVTGVPPVPDASEGAREMLRLLFPRSAVDMRAATPEAEAVAEQLIVAKAESATAATREEALENKMRFHVGDAEGLRGDGWQVTNRSTKTGARQFLFKTKPKREQAA